MADGAAQLQHADRPLPRGRRHEDRLYLRLRLQPRCLRHPRRQAADRSRAGRTSSAARAKGRPVSGARLQRSNGLAWLCPRSARSNGAAGRCRPAQSARRDVRRSSQASGRRERGRRGGCHMAPDSPYAVFLSSLRPPKDKGAPLLHDLQMGQPVLVFTGTKPPAPGAVSAAAKPKLDKEKTAATKPSRQRPAQRPPPQPSPQPGMGRQPGRSPSSGPSPRRQRPAQWCPPQPSPQPAMWRQSSRSPSLSPISRRQAPARRHRQQP